MDFGSVVRDELSGSMARTYISHISNYHRVQASTMYHDASVHIVDELRRMGLDDVQIIQLPADGKRKYWLHRSTVGWSVKSAELHMLEPRKELLADFEDVPMSLHTYSQATPKEGVTAELVEVGSGCSAEDYKGKKVKGKIVLVSGSSHTAHVEAVVKRGAAGVITDTFEYEFPGVRESIDIPDARSYRGIWPTSDTVAKTRFGFSVSKRKGDELRALLADGKKILLHAKVDAKLFKGKYDIVTATIRGSSKPDEEVFLSAHLCHPKPGANDNASGSGMLMEVARTITALIGSGKIGRPARTIRFIWVPETTGTVALLATHPEFSKRLVAGINLDMVGEDQEKCESTLHLSTTPDSLPSYLNDLVWSKLEKSSKELDRFTKIGLASKFRFAKTAFSPGSDHSEFVDSSVGVPCVSMTQWPDKYYHSSMDTIDKVSEDSLRRVGWATASAVLKIADADSRTAHELAALTYSKGAARLAEASGRASEEVFKVIHDTQLKDKGQALAKAFTFHKARLDHVVEREQGAVRSVLMLARTRDLETYVDRQVKNLAEAGRRDIDTLRTTVGNLAASLKIRIPENPRETGTEREARKMVPKRRFRGTLPWSDMMEMFCEKSRAEYKRLEDTDLDFASKVAEAVNLMDGSRSAYDIALALSAQYAPTDPAFVTMLLRDLKTIKLVSF